MWRTSEYSISPSDIDDGITPPLPGRGESEHEETGEQGDPESIARIDPERHRRTKRLTSPTRAKYVATA
jgi:hypothetical protein